MSSKAIIILGIESSCDETSAAVLHEGKILANIIASQKVHELYGGVVPELASRAHQQNIVPVVSESIKEAGINLSDISAVAYTRGPGLLGALLVGSSFAKGLSLGLNIPLIEVNHMQAHIHAHFISEDGKEVPGFPFLCLTVSGGHTQIVMVKDYFSMEVIGETLDDAAGEAFDKIAKVLGLPYPGGPVVDKLAKEGRSDKFKFPHPKVPDLNYSFSGLKTSFLNFIKKETAANAEFVNENLNDICASIQQSIVDILFDKLIKAAENTGVKTITLAGGVSANSLLRSRLKSFENEKGWKTFIPKFEFCTDNAAMIAMTGYLKYKMNDFSSQQEVPSARYTI